VVSVVQVPLEIRGPWHTNSWEENVPAQSQVQASGRRTGNPSYATSCRRVPIRRRASAASAPSTAPAKPLSSTAPRPPATAC
jgi:hypothetical protein